MHELSSVDIAFLAKELQALVGGRVERIYAPAENELLLQVRCPGRKVIARFIVPSLFYVASLKDDMPEKPSQWCAVLRSLLDGMKIIDVRQPRSERLLLIEFAVKDATRRMYLEFYGKGNMIVTDETNKILGVLWDRDFKDRKVARHEQYVLPGGNDAFALDKPDFIRALLDIGKGAASSLAMFVGQTHAKELCRRAAVDPASPLDDASAGRLHNALHDALDGPLAAQTVAIEGKPSDALPFDAGGETAASFSAAIERVVRANTGARPRDAATRKIDEQRARIASSIAAQETALAKLEKAHVEAQRVGEHLYEQYTQYKTMLEEFTAARKKGKAAIDALQEKHGVKEYRAATGEIVLEKDF